MKKVVGGGFEVYSCAPTGSGRPYGECTNMDYTKSEADTQANAYNTNNPDPSNPYVYVVGGCKP